MNIPFEPDRGHRQEVTVWHSNVPGLVYNGEVSEWFSDALQRNCQLVLMPESTERHVSERFDQGKDIVSFADGYPLMLLGEGSLAELNHRIEEKYKDADEGVRGPLYKDADEGVRGPAPVPMNRFRPNLVVRGSDPFEEDKWAKIRVGEAVFRVVKPCGRCVITTIDPARGEFDGKEPLKTLATFRMAKDVFPTSYGAFEQKPNAVLFGENLIPENPGTTITVGDEITVLEMRSSRK